MKNLNNIKGGFVMVALLALISCMFTSCSDDEGSGQPVITGVRVCDPQYADSLFTKSSQGQVVAIIGNNLSNCQKITINGQNVGFSPTMNTDHSVIITIPSETNGFELGAFNPDIKEEIYLETTHGSCTYAFQVLTAAPSISRIQGAYPRQAGDNLNVFGSNLVSINSIYFTDITAAELDSTEWEEIGGNHVEVTDYKTVVMDHYLNSKTLSYTTDSQLALTIPNLPYDKGSLVIDCAAGVVYIAYSKLPGVPVIKSINTDMPVIGENLVLKGNEFVQIESVTFGDVTYTADELTVSESEDEITVPITKVPSVGSGSTLTLTTVGGSTTVNGFYDYSTLLVDFDDNGVDNGWDPKATIEPSDIGGTNNVAHMYVENEGQQWWGQMIFFRHDWEDNVFPLPTSISDDTPSTDIFIAMEVYNNESDYNNGVFSGYLRWVVWPVGASTDNSDPYQLDNFEWDDYDAQTFINPVGPILGDCEGNTPQKQWYRHVMCIDKLPAYTGMTYKEIKNLGISNIRIQSINQALKQGKIDFYVDNIRIIKKNW